MQDCIARTENSLPFYFLPLSSSSPCPPQYLYLFMYRTLIHQVHQSRGFPRGQSRGSLGGGSLLLPAGEPEAASGGAQPPLPISQVFPLPSPPQSSFPSSPCPAGQPLQPQSLALPQGSPQERGGGRAGCGHPGFVKGSQEATPRPAFGLRRAVWMGPLQENKHPRLSYKPWFSSSPLN